MWDIFWRLCWQSTRDSRTTSARHCDDKKLESKTDDKKQENWSQRLMTRIKRTGVKDWWQETGVKDWWQETGELESRTDDKNQENWSHKIDDKKLESKTDDKKQENWSQGLMTRNRRAGVTDWCQETEDLESLTWITTSRATVLMDMGCTLVHRVSIWPHLLTPPSFYVSRN